MLKSTRFTYSMYATTCTVLLLAFGNLSDGAQVAAFGFLGTIAIKDGASKFAEKWKDGKE